MSYPTDLRYSRTHEWVRLGKDGIMTIGITDYAQGLLGDLVFVELPKLGRSVKVGEETAVVESVKTAADVYSPVSGSIIAVNEALQQTPGTVNADPYQSGWLFKVKPADEKELAGLLDASGYQEMIKASL
jgi:glycine cleavage system H protein